MKSQFQKQIKHQLLANAKQKEKNQINLEDQQIIKEVFEYNWKIQNFQQKTYDVELLKLGLEIQDNLQRDIFHHFLDQIQFILGANFEKYSKGNFRFFLKYNLQHFCQEVLNYIFLKTDTSSNDLLHIKLRSLLKHLEIRIINFLKNYQEFLQRNLQVTEKNDKKSDSSEKNNLERKQSNSPQFQISLLDQCLLDAFFKQNQKSPLFQKMNLEKIKRSLETILSIMPQNKEYMIASAQQNSERFYFITGMFNMFFDNLLDINLFLVQSYQENLFNVHKFLGQFLQQISQNEDNIENAPQTYIFFLKLIKERQHKLVLDNLNDIAQKSLYAMFSTLQKNINYLNLSQIISFCDKFEQIVFLGYDFLEQINFYQTLRNIHKSFINILQIVQNNEKEGDRVFLYRKKIKYLAIFIEKMYVISSRWVDNKKDDYKTKTNPEDDPKLQKILDLLTIFQETFQQSETLLNLNDQKKSSQNQSQVQKKEENLNVEINQNQNQAKNNANQNSGALQNQSQNLPANLDSPNNNTNGHHQQVYKSLRQGKHYYNIEEKIQKNTSQMISLISIANAFLQNTSRFFQSKSFRPDIIAKIILPKFALSAIMQQPQMKKQVKLTKKLFKFYVNLIYHIGHEKLRERALKDLAQSLYYTFNVVHTDDSDFISSIASYMQRKIYNLDFSQQIRFLHDIIKSCSNSFYEIEEAYANYKETQNINYSSKFNHNNVNSSLKNLNNFDSHTNGKLALGKSISENQSLYQNNFIKGSNFNEANITTKEKQVLKILEFIPFITSCAKIFLLSYYQNQNDNLKIQTADVLTEFWIFIVLNQEIIESKLSEEINQQIDELAILTPNLLEGESIAFCKAKIITLIQKKDYLFKDFQKAFKSQFKIEQVKNIEEMIHLLMIKQIFQRRLNIVNHSLQRIRSYYKPSILENIFTYLNKQGPNIKLMKYVQSIVYNTCQYYLQRFQNEKLTNFYVKEEVIYTDIQYLIEASCSLNEQIRDQAQILLLQYLKSFPQHVFVPETLMIFSETITEINKKCWKEYYSVSTILKGKHLRYSISMPTDISDNKKILIFLMKALQLMIVRGHFIDNNFLKVLVQHIVKQEMMVSSKLDFGYRFLKYISITFRGERNTVIEDIYDYNSFLWLIDPQKFNESVEKSKIENYVVDRNLCELYQMKNDVSHKHINKIFSLIETSIHNEIEIEFQLNEIQIEQQTQQYSLNNYGGQNQIQYAQQRQQQNNKQYDLNQFNKEIDEIANISFNINFIQLMCTNKKLIKSHIKHLIEKQPNLKKNLLPEVVKEVTQSHIEANNLIAIKKSLKKSQIKKVASLNVFISHSSIPKNVVLSKLLDICRVYYQPRLLDYILSRFIPYIHSLHHNYFDSTLFYILGEILNYVVSQINNFGGFYLPKYVNDTNIFSIRQNYFYDLIPYEMKEFSMNYFEIFSQIKHSSHYQYWISLLTNHVGVYDQVENQEQEQNKLSSHYYKMLKFALYHFSKVETFWEVEAPKKNTAEALFKIKIYLKTCKYIAQDSLHEIFPNTFKKKRKKRYSIKETATSSKVKNYNKLKSELSQFQSPKQKDMLQINKSYYNQMHQDGEFYKITEKSTWFKKIEAGIGYKNSNIFALSYYQDPKKGEKSIKHGLIRKILCKTYSEEIDKLKSIYFTEFQHIKNPFSSTSQISDKQMQKMLNELQNFSPTLSYYLVHTFSHNLKNPNKFYDQIGEKIADISAYKNFLNCPQFLDLYMNYYKDNELMLREILYWKAPDIQLLMKYINNDYQDQQFLQLYFTKAMKLLFAQQLIFYLPQIFLSLGTNAGPIIQHFLLDYALDADMFAHQLMWMARVESYQVQEDIEKNQQLEKIAILARAIRKKLWRNMTQDSKNYFKKLDTFFESLTEISTTIKPKDPKDHKNEVIQKNLKQIQDNLPTNCYLPTNNEWEVVSIIPESGRALQSAAKCPFMVTFNCKKYYRQKENQQIDMVKKNSCENLDDSFNECHDKSFIKYLQNPIKINKFPDQKQVDNKRNKLNNNSSIDKKNNLSSNNATNSSQGEEIFSNDLGKQEQKMKAASVRSQIKYDTYKSLLKHNVQAVIDLPQDKNKITNQKGKGKQEKNQKIPCIFKVNDDIRQDNLALQIIQLFQYVFQKNQLDLIVFPYKTIATRTGKQDNIGGIIEVVRDSQSRDEIGKKNDYNLYTYFQNKFGNENSIEFQRARENFIKSQAPYSIISYILQIKDRHNGNILIDEHGHLIHIDFGFIFTISPAKNLGFERANFKLTEEMIKIMGGSKNSEAFQFYVNQTIKAFLAARKYHQHMINVIELMTRSSLPCFRKGAMESLAKRFMLDKNDIEASIQMKKIIYNAYDNIFTRIYDSFQQLTNKIHK